MRRFLNRGPALTPTLTTLVSATVLALAIISGSDYIAVPENSVSSLSAIELSVPLDLWGAYMIAAAFLAIWGWSMSCWWLVVLAHSMLGGIYVAFGAGSLILVFEEDIWYGWRFGATRLCVSVIHFALAKAAWAKWDLARDLKDVGVR